MAWWLGGQVARERACISSLTQGIIFVVDSSDRLRMVVAKDELDMLLQVLLVETIGIESGRLGVGLSWKCTK